MNDPSVPPLRRAVEVMDRLRSPGGCAWDAEQTAESLARYLIEECYEVLEAIETGDVRLLREELGDLLLQVLFHARIAQELPSGQAFGIDEVAADLVDKLMRRHPHVFAADGQPPSSAADLNETWEQQKIVEKGRTSAVDGVPIAQPALALTAKLVSRAARAGLSVETSSATDEIGDRLLAVVQDAVAVGIDPETALRRRARALRASIKIAESR
ncbi:MAG: MazG family protein [Actinomycetota bacterium]|nr:MazG family protein [Actinomycetota bacterium]